MFFIARAAAPILPGSSGLTNTTIRFLAGHLPPSFCSILSSSDSLPKCLGQRYHSPGRGVK